MEFETLETLLPIANIEVKEVGEYSTSIQWEPQGKAAERYVLNQEGPFSEKKYIVMANHEKSTASTKLRNLIPDTPYKGDSRTSLKSLSAINLSALFSLISCNP